MKIKIIAIWKIMWSYNFVAFTDMGVSGRTDGSDNGKFIKALIDSTNKMKNEQGLNHDK